MKCKKCGTTCKLQTSSTTKGKDYSIKKAIIGGILNGHTGGVWGLTEGRTTEVSAYWVCPNCGYKEKT